MHGQATYSTSTIASRIRIRARCDYSDPSCLPMKTAYTYTVLRYVHDVASGEFANVGVVLLAPEGRYAGARCRGTHGRVSRFFPDMEKDGFKALMGFIERRVDELGTRLRDELPLDQVPLDAGVLGRSVLPHDDSSLQWRPVGGGLCTNPSEKLDELFQRYVSRYEDKASYKGRDDGEVWKRFKASLDARHVTARLQTKRIAGADDEVDFAHACRNSQWHCFEPLSLDLAQADSIKQKAHRWLGQMMGVQDAPDTFRVYFLVGAPQDERLHDSYESALKLLRKSPVDVEIITEGHAEAFAGRMAEIVATHERGQG